MSKPEWGTKRICLNCQARFYDLCRQPIMCPKCNTLFDPDLLVKKRRGRPPTSESKSQTPEIDKSIDLEIDEDLDPLEDSDDVLEDTSDFGEDEKVVDIDKRSDED